MTGSSGGVAILPPAAPPAATFNSDALTGHAAPPPAARRKSDITPEDAAAIIKMVRDLPPEVKLCLMRFWSGGMSYGSISLEAHETIATAMNLIAMGIHNVDTMEELIKLGIKGMPFSNSGEGGERPDRNGTIKQSRARQKATACFGVNLAYLVYSIIIEHKGNQGGKAGIGGQLMAIKVTVEIANTRMTPDHVDLKSPAPHHDIYSIEDLAIWIHSIRSVNPDAIIAVKLAATEGIGVIAAALVKAGVTKISIAGPGGTGAAPLEAKYNFARPWEAALAEVHRTLTENGLREGVMLSVSGGFQTGEEAAKALLLGADNIELGTMILGALGCIMAEDCHTGNCSTGLATTNQENVDKNFKGTALDVVRLLTDVATSLSETLDEIGIADPEDAVGMASENLEIEPGCPVTGMEKMLEKPVNPYSEFTREPKKDVVSEQEKAVIEEIRRGARVVETHIDNTILSFGARTANRTLTDPDIEKAFVEPVTIKVNGEAVGQNFGCYIPENMTLDARDSRGNDHVGKGISLGRIIIKTAGGAAGYGGTGGEIYTTFLGDRAGVRNSGVHYVVEQVGECGANYGTPLEGTGTWTIWGMPKDYPVSFSYGRKNPVKFRSKSIGANFGAGTSAGVFFIPKKLYHEMVASHYFADELLYAEVQTLDEGDAQTLKRRLTEYRGYFDSENESWLKQLAEITDLENHFVKLDARVRAVPPPVTEPVVAPSEVAVVAAEVTPIAAAPAEISAPAEVVALLEKEAKSVTTDDLQQSVTLPEGHDACGIGTVVNRDGIPTRDNATDGFKMLAHMEHRGSSGVDPKTGDGCGGVLFGLTEFFRKHFPHLNLVDGHYSIIPMSMGDSDEAESRELLERFLKDEGLSIQGERNVETNRELLGEIGQRQEKTLKQYVVIKPESISQEAFEKLLIRARLRFELTLQLEKKKNRAHIFSASSYHVIYKTLVKEHEFGNYFLDFLDEDFKTSAVVTHARYATNTLPRTINVQGLAKFSNNGENNALMQIIRLLVNEPIFKKLVKLDKIDLSDLSDSHIMSIFMDFLVLLGYSIEEIVNSTIHPYDSEESIYKIASEFYNLFTIPFEGPNASVIYINNKIVFVRDKNGFRPLRGEKNKTTIFAGSELGPVTIAGGDMFDLAPGRPVVLDLKTGKLTEVVPAMTDDMAKRLGKFKAPSTATNKKPSILYAKEELAQRKLRAGWNEEVNDAIMKSLFEGKNALTSMGDQGPVEVLVKGMLLDIANFFKGNFSQYTNPPLAQHEEERYMSTKTFVGKKSGLEELALDKLAASPMQGVVLDSPIVSNDELEALKQDPRLRSTVIDITFRVNNGEQGLREALERVVNDSIRAVHEGHTLIILSDLQTDDQHAAIPAVLIASMVDQALLINGLRRQASIALQAGSMLSGRDIAQAISIGGADIVNPYLPFIPETEEQAQSDEFKKRTDAYKKALRSSLLSFMARMGISSVSAYRGTKGFGAYGLDAELAALFGVPSTFGGFGMSMLADVTAYHHEQASVKGSGKWNHTGEQGQASRRRFWGEGNATYAVGVARRRPGHTFKEFERKVKDLKRGFASSWLRFKNKRWTRANPMPIFILGGGAAGFYQAQALLEAMEREKIPVKVILIEKNIGNKFGLLGDGVSPDHSGTKAQGPILGEVLADERVEYYGGVEVDGKGHHVNVSYEELRQYSPCIIDCRGAPQDNRLNVPGEKPPYVIPASVVHKSYNGAFEPGVKPWTFDSYNRNATVGIVGIGNVAVDLTRIFLKDPTLLAKTPISPGFLESLENGPSVVRIFARRRPQDYAETTSLSGLKVLAQLGVDISAIFTPLSSDEVSALKPDQKDIYDFFEQYRDKKYPVSGRKKIVFHFETKARDFKPHHESKGVIGTFNNTDGSTSTIKAQTFITAISTDIPSDRSKASYSSGWAAGNGGTLAVAQQTAEETTKQIVKDWKEEKLKRDMTKPTLSTGWKHRSPILKGDYQKLLAWVNAGNQLETEEDMLAARGKGGGGSVTMEPRQKKVALKEVPKPGPEVDRRTVRIRNHIKGTDISYNVPVNKKTVLAFVNEQAPHGEVLVATCEGKQTCGECKFAIEEVDQVPDLHPKEKKRVDDPDNNGATLRFGCAHHMDELGGATIRLVDTQPAFTPAEEPSAREYSVPVW